jgi:hypothetical protein
LASSVAAAGLAAITTTEAPPTDAGHEHSLSDVALATGLTQLAPTMSTPAGTGRGSDGIFPDETAAQPAAADRQTGELAVASESAAHEVGRSELPFETRETANDVGQDAAVVPSPAALTVAIPPASMLQAAETENPSGPAQDDAAVAKVLADALPGLVDGHDPTAAIPTATALHELQAIVVQGAPDAGFHQVAGLMIEYGVFHPDAMLPT